MERELTTIAKSVSIAANEQVTGEIAEMYFDKDFIPHRTLITDDKTVTVPLESRKLYVVTTTCGFSTESKIYVRDPYTQRWAERVLRKPYAGNKCMYYLKYLGGEAANVEPMPIHINYDIIVAIANCRYGTYNTFSVTSKDWVEIAYKCENLASGEAVRARAYAHVWHDKIEIKKGKGDNLPCLSDDKKRIIWEKDLKKAEQKRAYQTAVSCGNRYDEGRVYKHLRDGYRAKQNPLRSIRHKHTKFNWVFVQPNVEFDPCSVDMIFEFENGIVAATMKR